MVWKISSVTVRCGVVSKNQLIYVVLPGCFSLSDKFFNRLQIIEFMCSTAALVSEWYGVILSCLTPHSFVN